jgi:hypothetical protein
MTKSASRTKFLTVPVVQGDDQVELSLPGKPGERAPVLVQHHPLAGLPRPLAPVRPAPLGPLDQARRVQLRLGPGVAPGEAVPPLKVLVEVLHVPAQIVGAVLSEHPGNLVHRNPLLRRLAQPSVGQAFNPRLLKPVPVAAELPLRTPQQLACLHRRQLFPLPPAQNVPKLLHPAIL